MGEKYPSPASKQLLILTNELQEAESSLQMHAADLKSHLAYVEDYKKKIEIYERHAHSSQVSIECDLKSIAELKDKMYNLLLSEQQQIALDRSVVIPVPSTEEEIGRQN